jgi:hypothetical protein
MVSRCGPHYLSKERKMKFTVEYDDVGLWYGTSEDDRGLLVAGKTRDECIMAIPKALNDLEAARNNRRIEGKV